MTTLPLKRDMDRDPVLDNKILSSTETTRFVHERLQRFPQGQIFELHLRPNTSSPFHYHSLIAGSSLYSVPSSHWRHVFSDFSEGGQFRQKITDSIVIDEYNEKPVFWRLPSHYIQQENIEQLIQQVVSLCQVAKRYQEGMQYLLHRLKKARTVEDWQTLSRERATLVQETMVHVLQWSKNNLAGRADDADLDVTILLSGSCTRGLGMVSDIDFIPVFASPQKQNPVGREMMEQVASGLSTCGIKADNIVAGSSFHRFIGLRLQHWQSDFSKVRSYMRLASALNSFIFQPAAGNTELADTFINSLSFNQTWRPKKRKWHRRWIGWWSGVQTELGQVQSALATPAQVHFHLRQLTILSEMLSFIQDTKLAETARSECLYLRAYLAWLRDIFRYCVTYSTNSFDRSYLEQVATMMGMKSPEEFNHCWIEWEAKLNSLADTIFKSVGLSRFSYSFRHYLGKQWMDKTSHDKRPKSLIHLKFFDLNRV